MGYAESEARELVLKAGLKLVENKLISRTWGNISARISDDEFIITPSGRAYAELTPADLVKVKISDLSYEGDIKPSSEKGVHAAAYAHRPDINFVIHTHQFYATVCAADEQNLPFAPCAKYGLPGSDKLKEHMDMCFAIHPEDKSFLMAKHGAVILGASYEEAFELAEKLEAECKEVVKAKAPNKRPKYKRAWIDDYAQIVGFGLRKSDEDFDAVSLITKKNEAAAEYVSKARPMGLFDEALQRIVYLKKYSKLNKTNK